MRSIAQLTIEQKLQGLILLAICFVAVLDYLV
jgi:hypothetical protein